VDVAEAVEIAASAVTEAVIVAIVATVEASSVVVEVDEAVAAIVAATVVATPSEAADAVDQLDPTPHASTTPRRFQLWVHRHVYLTLYMGSERASICALIQWFR